MDKGALSVMAPVQAIAYFAIILTFGISAMAPVTISAPLMLLTLLAILPTTIIPTILLTDVKSNVQLAIMPLTKPKQIITNQYLASLASTVAKFAPGMNLPIAFSALQLGFSFKGHACFPVQM